MYFSDVFYFFSLEDYVLYTLFTFFFPKILSKKFLYEMQTSMFVCTFCIITFFS